MWMVAGGGESKCSKMKEKKCRGDEEKEVVAVEKKKTTNKESVSETPGLRPQAQSVEAHGWCLGPILGSMHDPAVEDHEAVAAWPVLTLSPPAPGTNWADWSDTLGREMYLHRALDRLNLEYPSNNAS
jgi:hypothetical protein